MVSRVEAKLRDRDSNTAPFSREDIEAKRTRFSRASFLQVEKRTIRGASTNGSQSFAGRDFQCMGSIPSLVSSISPTAQTGFQSPPAVCAFSMDRVRENKSPEPYLPSQHTVAHQEGGLPVSPVQCAFSQIRAASAFVDEIERLVLADPAQTVLLLPLEVEAFLYIWSEDRKD
jgi:hypothetical protein